MMPEASAKSKWNTGTSAVFVSMARNMNLISRNLCCRQHLRLLHMLPIYQMILNLTGNSDNILDMYNGQAMEFRIKLGWGKTSRDGEVAQWAYSLQLYVYCENWSLAEEMYDKLINLDPEFMRGFPAWHNRVFFFALVAIHRVKAASWLKRPIFMRDVQRHVALMRLWVTKHKAINLVQKYYLLQAELLTLKPTYPNDRTLMNAYDKAIQAAMRAGYPQDAGLASAMAAHALKDPCRQEDYARLAQDSYERWGALGLLHQLRNESELHKRAGRKGISEHSSRGFRGRRRFHESITSIHKEISLDSTRNLWTSQSMEDVLDSDSGPF